MNSAPGAGKARQENEGGFLTRALEGGLRRCGGASGWGPGTGRLCSMIAAADAGEHRVQAVPGAFVRDLESTVLFARLAAAIRKVLQPMGKALKSPRQRPWSSSKLCTCSSGHAKP